MDLLRVQYLCDTLDGHLDRYQQLIDYIAWEKKYLLAHDLENLFMVSSEKETLACSILENIHTLVEAINETALMLGLPLDPQPLLVDLVSHLPKPYANHINAGSIRLVILKNIVLRENEANRHFIAEAQRLINESINILTGANQLQSTGYKKNGKQEEKRHTRPVKLSREV